MAAARAPTTDAGLTACASASSLSSRSSPLPGCGRRCASHTTGARDERGAEARAVRGARRCAAGATRSAATAVERLAAIVV
jgi:hypothetical protein